MTVVNYDWNLHSDFSFLSLLSIRLFSRDVSLNNHVIMVFIFCRLLLNLVKSGTRPHIWSTDIFKFLWTIFLEITLFFFSSKYKCYDIPNRAFSQCWFYCPSTQQYLDVHPRRNEKWHKVEFHVGLSSVPWKNSQVPWALPILRTPQAPGNKPSSFPNEKYYLGSGPLWLKLIILVSRVLIILVNSSAGQAYETLFVQLATVQMPLQLFKYHCHYFI